MKNNTSDYHNHENSLNDQLTNEDILLSKYNEIWITHQQFIDSVTRLSKPELLDLKSEGKVNSQHD